MNILNIFKRKTKVHIVNPDLSFIKKNIKLKNIPHINQKIYFDEEKIYNITDIMHYYNKGVQVTWIIIEEYKKDNNVLDGTFTFEFPEDKIFISKKDVEIPTNHKRI